MNSILIKIKNRIFSNLEKFIENLLRLSAAITILVTIGILYVLVSESIIFFQEVSIVDFFTDR